jgi:hypothetical protein
MKRVWICLLALAGLAATAVLPDVASAAGGIKPTKIPGTAVTMDGGQPYPLGLVGQYGVIQLTWPTPAALENITGYTVTCTPKYFKTNTGPLDPIVVTVSHINAPPAGVSSTGGTPGGSDFQIAGATTKLKVREIQNGADTVYPPRVCRVDATNALATKVGKATKLPIGSTPNCGVLPQPDQTPPDLVTDPKKPKVFAGVELPALSNALFCSTDSTTAKATWSSDQSVVFTSKSKFKRDKKFLLADPDGSGPLKAPKCYAVDPIGCPSYATIKKLGLISGVNTALTLVISGTDVVWEYDATNVHVATGTNTGCVASKPDPLTSCTVTESGGIGTITLHSTVELTIKPGKLIKSPTIDITFDTGGAPAGDYPIWFKSATTTITLGTNVVDIKLKSLPQVVADQVGFLASPYNGAAPNPAAYASDLNYGPAAPIAHFTVTAL